MLYVSLRWQDRAAHPVLKPPNDRLSEFLMSFRVRLEVVCAKRSEKPSTRPLADLALSIGMQASG